MPTVGPHGRIAYYPHEPYNLIGRRLFQHEWEGGFAGKPPIPDLNLIRRQSEQGAQFPAEIAEFLNADPEQAERMQTQRRRQDEVLQRLINALHYGKAECWLKERSWRPVLYHEWQEDTETRRQLTRLLKEEIAAVLRDGKPPAGRLLIDKEGLDQWERVEARTG